MVVGFGGYVSVPAYLAARKRKLPLVVHEGNALPGIANKLGARFTTHVATSFPATDLPHALYIGLPIRRMISTLDRAALRDEGRVTFGLDPDLPTLLVTGGSDCYGLSKGKPLIGGVKLQYEYVEKLKTRAEESKAAAVSP